MEPHGSSAGKEIEGEPWQFKGGIFQDWLYAYETAKYHRTRCGCVCVCIYKHIGEKARFPRLSGREGCTRDTVILYCAGRFVDFRGKIPCIEERYI